MYYDEAADRQAAAAYYGDIDATGSLFEQLSRKVVETHANELSYDPSRHLYPWVDLQPDGSLRSIYSGQVLNAEEIIRSDFYRLREEGDRLSLTMAAASLSPETGAAFLAIDESNRAFNCEHVVPQSWFSKRQPMKGDLHHLFACDPRCNSSRGNLPYYDFPENDDTIRDGCGRIDHQGRRFEPEGGKGAVARATLYFLLRYPGAIDDYSKEDVATLLRWHREDPVSLYEQHRNAAIAEVQGNRNPLIDHPEWAERIDFARGLGT